MTLAQRSRDIYNAIKKKTGIAPTPATLRMEQVLKNNVSQYVFNPDIKSPVGAQIGLRKQDIFICIDWGLFITKEATAAKGTGVLQTYVNTTFFPAVAGPPAFTPDHLQAIYNGYLDSYVDKSKIYEFFSADNFQVIPQTHQSATIAKSQRGQDDGFVAIDPLQMWNGERVNQVILTIPTFAGIAIESQVAGTDNLVVFMPRGFLLSNASNNQLLMDSIEEMKK